MDIENLLSLDVLYMDIVRMIKLYTVWTVIVAVIVAYLQNIKYQFFPYFSCPFPAKRPISPQNGDYFILLPFAMHHGSHPLFTGLEKLECQRGISQIYARLILIT